MILTPKNAILLMLFCKPRMMFLGLMVVFTSFLTTTLFAQELREVEKLDSKVNTEEYDEASPVISLDGNSLYFTRTGSPDFERSLTVGDEDISDIKSESEYRMVLSEIYSQLAGKPVRDPYISPFNQDIFILQGLLSTIDSVYHPGPPLNNALPNSILSASADTNKLVVVNQFYESGNMYEGFSSVLVDSLGNFSFPQPIHIYDFHNLSGSVSLAMARHGLIMILSIEHEDSFGKNDLYVSFKISEDLWSAPVNLGSEINTPAQEATPFITQDGRSLYFASDRPGTAGGTDIWVSQRLDYTWKNWSEPMRLMEPVNSEFDEGQACIDETGSYIYFASRRDGTSDLFRMPLQPKPKLSKPIQINGRIVDGDTGEAIRAELYYGPENLESYLEYFHTYTGLFNAELHEHEVYKFFARKPGYQPANLKFDARLADMQDLDEHFMVLKLYKMQVVKPPAEENDIGVDSSLTFAEQLITLDIGETLPFHKLHFQKSKSIVSPKSYPALDELIDEMNKKPSLKIRFEGHTDNVGNEKDLMELSWARANAVKSYLVVRGIDEDRVMTIGYGPQNPISDNYSEAHRSKNRRVEVRVMEK